MPGVRSLVALPSAVSLVLGLGVAPVAADNENRSGRWAANRAGGPWRLPLRRPTRPAATRFSRGERVPPRIRRCHSGVTSR